MYESTRWRRGPTDSRDPSQESLLLRNRSLSGRFYLAVYAADAGNYTVDASRQVLANDEDDTSFLWEVRQRMGPWCCRCSSPPHPTLPAPRLACRESCGEHHGRYRRGHADQPRGWLRVAHLVLEG